MQKRIIKPGKWIIVRVRQIESYEQVTGYLVCTNAYHVGHNGWSRKWRMKNKRVDGRITKVRHYKSRQWTIKGYRERRLAYKFADIADAKTSAKVKLMTDWMKLNNGFVEFVEVDGCTYNGTVLSETVVLRRYQKGTNEMMILALETNIPAGNGS
jgi:hypothetical protein